MLKRGDQYLLLSFDTESDIGSWTQNYSSIDQALPLILNVLADHDIRATFFCEGMAALHNESMIRRVAEAGHEIGCHSFKHETLGDVSYFIPGDRAILPEEIPNRIRKTTEVLERITGKRPISFRAPRLWGSGQLCRVLEDQGYLADSSYPISRAEDQSFPYHPDCNDWSQAGETNILEVPIAGAFDGMVDTMDDGIKAFGDEISIDPESKSIGQWPILRLYGAQRFADYLKPIIARQMEQEGYSVTCVYLHPWEFITMPSVLPGVEARVELARLLHENCGQKTLTAMDEFINIFKDKGFQFITTTDIYELWEN